MSPTTGLIVFLGVFALGASLRQWGIKGETALHIMANAIGFGIAVVGGVVSVICLWVLILPMG